MKHAIRCSAVPCVTRYFEPYADISSNFSRGYAADGVHRALTVQNDQTDQNGRMPQCTWGQDTIQFLEQFLGPALEMNSLDTKIWTPDHNYNLWGRVDE